MAVSPPQDGNLLRIADLSRLLELPESTIRYYCKRFAHKLPQVGVGRQRRYQRESLEILQSLIAPLRRDKAFAPDASPAPADKRAKPALRARSDHVPADPGLLFADQIMELMERQTRALQQIALALETLAVRQKSEVMLLPETIADNALIRNDLEALRLQLRATEDAHKKDLEQTRKWLALLSETMSRRGV